MGRRGGGPGKELPAPSWGGCPRSASSLLGGKGKGYTRGRAGIVPRDAVFAIPFGSSLRGSERNGDTPKEEEIPLARPLGGERAAVRPQSPIYDGSVVGSAGRTSLGHAEAAPAGSEFPRNRKSVSSSEGSDNSRERRRKLSLLIPAPWTQRSTGT